MSEVTNIPLLTRLSTPVPNRSMEEDDYVPAADTFAAELYTMGGEINLALEWTAEQVTLIGEVKDQAVGNIETVKNEAVSQIETQARDAVQQAQGYAGNASDSAATALEAQQQSGLNADRAEGAVSVLADGAIADTVVTNTDTWSSQKISSELSSKQDNLPEGQEGQALLWSGEGYTPQDLPVVSSSKEAIKEITGGVVTLDYVSGLNNHLYVDQDITLTVAVRSAGQQVSGNLFVTGGGDHSIEISGQDFNLAENLEFSPVFGTKLLAGTKGGGEEYNEIRDFRFFDEGSTLLIADYSYCRKHTLSTPYDFSTQSQSEQLLSLSGSEHDRGTYICRDGLHIYHAKEDNNLIYLDTLSYRLDLETDTRTSANLETVFSDASLTLLSTGSSGITVSDDGENLYCIARTSEFEWGLYKLSMSAPHDLSTLQYDSFYDLAGAMGVPDLRPYDYSQIKFYAEGRFFTYTDKGSNFNAKMPILELNNPYSLEGGIKNKFEVIFSENGSLDSTEIEPVKGRIFVCQGNEEIDTCSFYKKIDHFYFSHDPDSGRTNFGKLNTYNKEAFL